MPWEVIINCTALVKEGYYHKTRVHAIESSYKLQSFISSNETYSPPPATLHHTSFAFIPGGMVEIERP